MRLTLLAMVVFVAAWSRPAGAEEDAARPLYLPGQALPDPEPGAGRVQPRSVRSNQWVLGGTLGVDEARVAGLEVDVAEVDWISVLTRVGLGGRPEAATAARVTDARGRMGADVGASVAAEPGPLDLAARLRVWGSLDASAWLDTAYGWQLRAFVGAAEPLNIDPGQGPRERRLVGGLTVCREL